MGNDGRLLVVVVVTASIVLVDCDPMATTGEADDASPWLGVAASKSVARGCNGIVLGVSFASTGIQVVISGLTI
jgi:hypothetical protein